MTAQYTAEYRATLRTKAWIKTTVAQRSLIELLNRVKIWAITSDVRTSLKC